MAAGDDLNFADRFKREAQAMARLSHPNIVAVFDAGETPDGLLYFVMEFIEGTDVAQLIASEGKLDAARATSIISAVCEALAFAHEEGIVHRDIKPSNIMIDKRGRVKVADFGLAKVTSADANASLVTQSNVAMGTPDFIAPEAMIPGISVDGRADLYAVGVMLYQMLTGKIPRGRFELPSGVVPQVDKGFDIIVDRAMQTDRDKRYSTATEMKKDVESVVMLKEGSAGVPFGAAQPARSHPTGGSAAKKEAPKRGRAPLLIAAAVVVLGGGAFFLMREGSPGRADGPSSAAGTPQNGALGQSALPATTERWINALTSEAKLANRPDELTPEGLRFTGIRLVMNESAPKRDVAIRIRTTFVPSPTISGPQLRVRSVAGEAQYYTLNIDKNGRYAGLWRQGQSAVGTLNLGEFPLPIPLSAGEDYELELRAVGSHFTVKFNGQVLGEAEDTSPAEGRIGIGTTSAVPVLVKALEYLDLGSGAISPTPSLPVSQSSTAFPPGQWVKVLSKREEVDASNVGVRDKLRFEGGWMDASSLDPVPMLNIPKLNAANVGLRLRGKISPARSAGKVNSHVCALVLRSRTQGPTEAYHFSLGSNGIGSANLGVIHHATAIKVSERLHTHNLDRVMQPEEEFTMEFYAIGTQLLARFNGEWLPPVTDTRLKSGSVFLQTGHLVRDVEAINLDGLSEAEARKAAGVDPVSSSPSPQVSKSSTTSAAPAKPGPWIDATEKLRRSGQEKGLFTTEGEWLIATRRSPEYFPLSGNQELADVAVRVVFRHRVQVKLRRQPSAQKFGGYIVGVGNDRRGTGFSGDHPDREWVPPENAPVRSGPPEAEHELVFAAHGNHLMYWLDGRLMARITDDRYQKGHLELGTLMDETSDPKPTSIKKVEYMSLDGLSESEALKAAGTDTPAAAKQPRWETFDFSKMDEKTFADAFSGAAKLKGGLLHSTNYDICGWNGVRARNVALRTTLPVDANMADARLINSVGTTQTGVRLWRSSLEIFVNRSGQEKVYQRFKLVPELTRGGDAVLQMAIIGKRVFAWLDGRFLGDAEVEGMSEEVGRSNINAQSALFRSFEVLILDGLSEAEALKAAGIDPVSTSPTIPVSQSSAFPPGQWVKVLTKPEELHASNAGFRDKLRFEDGWMDASGLDPVPTLHIPMPGEAANVGLRLRGKIAPYTGKAKVTPMIGSLLLRWRTQGAVEFYQFSLGGHWRPSADLGVIHHVVATQKGERLYNRDLGRAMHPGEEYTMEFYAIGTQLLARFNNEWLPPVTDTRLKSGSVAIQNAHLIRDVEVINLDGLSEAEARKVAGVDSALPSQTSASWIAADLAAAPTNPKVTLNGRQLQVSNGQWRPLESKRFRQVAQRITFVWRENTANVKLITGNDSAAVHYGKLGASRSGGQFWEVGHYSGHDQRLDGSKPDIQPPLKPGDTAVFQFATLGDRHFVWLNGKLLGSATHPATAEGGGLSVYADELLLDRYE
jgi:hypothetical protein